MFKDFNDKLNPCPRCHSSDFISYESPCQDSDCCGLPNSILCNNCGYENEEYAFTGVFCGVARRLRTGSKELGYAYWRHKTRAERHALRSDVCRGAQIYSHSNRI